MTTCPVCAQAGPTRQLCRVNLIPGTEYDLVECPACRLIYFDPLPTRTELAAFYSASYYDFDRWREEGKGMAFARRLRRWKRTGKFLDVGCATGFFINGIRHHSDWEVFGTDFGESAVRFAREHLGLDVRHGELEDAGFPAGMFDYVHVNNVLEHVPGPVRLLKECRRIIKPDGVFFLSVPNGANDCLDLINFYREEKRPARSKNGHIFFFPSPTIRAMIADAGFTIMHARTYSIKRGLRSAGILPRKRDWKKDYVPRERTTSPLQQHVALPDPRKKHPDLYYHFRFLQGNLQRLPGLHSFGLDFLFMLHPA